MNITRQKALLEGLRSLRPQMHTNGEGRLADYGIDERLVPILRELVQPGFRTIETGSGLSTLVFLILGANHTSVSPDAEEPLRIREYCTTHEIGIETYTPVTGLSEDLLPQIPADASFDLALVDGSHSFPLPAMDWFYLGRRLKRGGIMILDDLQLWPCEMVADFLDGDDLWSRVSRNNRFGVYRLETTADRAMGRWWGAQPYVKRRSRSLFRTGWLSRLCR